MRNEFGEEITEDYLNEITTRIRKLTPLQIDEVYFRVGYIYTDESKTKHGYKAILPEYVALIQKSLESAKTVIEQMLLETPLEEVEKVLSQFEIAH